MMTPPGCLILLLAFLSTWIVARGAVPNPVEGAVAAKVASDAEDPGIFRDPTVVDIRLRLSSTAVASLEARPRDWVTADLEFAGRSLPGSSVRLKGKTSFMGLDRKPSFTLDVTQGKGNQARRVAGLRRIHLNNSAQDSSYLCDRLAGTIFRNAGVPAARVAWARVTLDQRVLGLYVLKEALDDLFLDRHFGEHRGNFYDGGLHREIDGELEKDSGDGVNDRSDLRALHAAAVNGPPESRWPALERVLDVDRFVGMLAAETVTVHLDGYSAMANNYRIYFEPGAGRAVFIAHGLDRMWEQPDWPVPLKPGALLSKSVLATPQGRERLVTRIRDALGTACRPDWVSREISNCVRVLAPLEPHVASAARSLEKRVQSRIQRVRDAVGGSP